MFCRYFLGLILISFCTNPDPSKHIDSYQVSKSSGTKEIWEVDTAKEDGWELPIMLRTFKTLVEDGTLKIEISSFPITMESKGHINEFRKNKN